MGAGLKSAAPLTRTGFDLFRDEHTPAAFHLGYAP